MWGQLPAAGRTDPLPTWRTKHSYPRAFKACWGEMVIIHYVFILKPNTREKMFWNSCVASPFLMLTVLNPDALLSEEQVADAQGFWLFNFSPAIGLMNNLSARFMSSAIESLWIGKPPFNVRTCWSAAGRSRSSSNLKNAKLISKPL